MENGELARRSSILHFFISRNIIERFSVGCDKVNCGNAAREGALGYDLGAPFPSAGKCCLFASISLARANNVRPYGIIMCRW